MSTTVRTWVQYRDEDDVPPPGVLVKWQEEAADPTGEVGTVTAPSDDERAEIVPGDAPSVVVRWSSGSRTLVYLSDLARLVP